MTALTGNAACAGASYAAVNLQLVRGSECAIFNTSVGYQELQQQAEVSGERRRQVPVVTRNEWVLCAAKGSQPRHASPWRIMWASSGDSPHSVGRRNVHVKNKAASLRLSVFTGL